MAKELLTLSEISVGFRKKGQRVYNSNKDINLERAKGFKEAMEWCAEFLDALDVEQKRS